MPGGPAAGVAFGDDPGGTGLGSHGRAASAAGVFPVLGNTWQNMGFNGPSL